MFCLICVDFSDLSESASRRYAIAISSGAHAPAVGDTATISPRVWSQAGLLREIERKIEEREKERKKRDREVEKEMERAGEILAKGALKTGPQNGLSFGREREKAQERERHTHQER